MAEQLFKFTEVQGRSRDESEGGGRRRRCRCRGSRSGPRWAAASAVAVVLNSWLTNSHISAARISSPAGGVEGAAASSFIDRLRDGWRPCP